MNWLRLSVQNWKRRKVRTGVTILGVAIAIAALFSLLSFQQGYQTGIRSELDRLGAHVLVVPKGCPYDAASIALHGASWPCYLKENYLTQVRSTEGVAVAAPLFMNAVYDEKTGEQFVYQGADPGLLELKRGWHLTGKFPETANGCLVGNTVAQKNGLKLGDTFVFPGLKGQTGTVTGIIGPTQGSDDTFVYLPLTRSQQLFKRPGQLTHILVRLSDPEKLDTVVGGLRACEAGMDMNIVPLAHLFRTIQGLISSTRALLGSIVLVALLVAGAGVSNTILMAVTERTREIGVLRAVGASRADIFRLIWLETAAACLIGGVLGIVLAIAGSRSLEHWLRGNLPFSPTDTLVRIDVGAMLLCILGAALLGSLAGLLPAWRAARLAPVEAIRTGLT